MSGCVVHGPIITVAFDSLPGLGFAGDVFRLGSPNRCGNSVAPLLLTSKPAIEKYN